MSHHPVCLCEWTGVQILTFPCFSSSAPTSRSTSPEKENQIEWTERQHTRLFRWDADVVNVCVMLTVRHQGEGHCCSCVSLDLHQPRLWELSHRSEDCFSESFSLYFSLARVTAAIYCVFVSMCDVSKKRRGHSVCSLDEDLMCPVGTCVSARVPVRALQVLVSPDCLCVWCDRSNSVWHDLPSCLLRRLTIKALTQWGSAPALTWWPLEELTEL